MAAFVVLVLVVSKFTSGATGPVRPVSASEVVTSDQPLENISVIGRVKGTKPAKGNIGTVMLLEGMDGYEYSAYLSEDVKHVPIRTGDQVQLVGSTIGQGAISVTKPTGIKVLKKRGRTRTVYGVEIRNGVASWQSGDFVTHVTTPLAAGYYNQLELTVDSYGRKVLEEVPHP